jgi:hypothetical protein
VAGLGAQSSFGIAAALTSSSSQNRRSVITRKMFRWTTLTVSFIGSAPFNELTPAAALDRAIASLKRCRANVSRDEDRGVLRFGPTFSSGRSWLWAVSNAQVHAATQGSVTILEVSASVAPIVMMGVAAAAVGSASNVFLGVLGGLGVIAGGNYALASYAMKRLLTEISSPAPAQSGLQHW